MTSVAAATSYVDYCVTKGLRVQETIRVRLSEASTDLNLGAGTNSTTSSSAAGGGGGGNSQHNLDDSRTKKQGVPLYLGPKQCLAVIQCLKHLPDLEVLNLEGTGMTDDLVDSLCLAIHSHEHLIEIDLTANPMLTDRSLSALLALAKNSPNLARLEVVQGGSKALLARQEGKVTSTASPNKKFEYADILSLHALHKVELQLDCNRLAKKKQSVKQKAHVAPSVSQRYLELCSGGAQRPGAPRAVENGGESPTPTLALIPGSAGGASPSKSNAHRAVDSVLTTTGRSQSSMGASLDAAPSSGAAPECVAAGATFMFPEDWEASTNYGDEDELAEIRALAGCGTGDGDPEGETIVSGGEPIIEEVKPAMALPPPRVLTPPVAASPAPASIFNSPKPANVSVPSHSPVGKYGDVQFVESEGSVGGSALPRSLTPFEGLAHHHQHQSPASIKDQEVKGAIDAFPNFKSVDDLLPEILRRNRERRRHEAQQLQSQAGGAKSNPLGDGSTGQEGGLDGNNNAGSLPVETPKLENNNQETSVVALGADGQALVTTTEPQQSAITTKFTTGPVPVPIPLQTRMSALAFPFLDPEFPPSAQSVISTLSAYPKVPLVVAQDLRENRNTGGVGPARPPPKGAVPSDDAWRAHLTRNIKWRRLEQVGEEVARLHGSPPETSEPADVTIEEPKRTTSWFTLPHGFPVHRGYVQADAKAAAAAHQQQEQEEEALRAAAAAAAQQGGQKGSQLSSGGGKVVERTEALPGVAPMDEVLSGDVWKLHTTTSTAGNPQPVTVGHDGVQHLVSVSDVADPTTTGRLMVIRDPDHVSQLQPVVPSSSSNDVLSQALLKVPCVANQYLINALNILRLRFPEVISSTSRKAGSTANSSSGSTGTMGGGLLVKALPDLGLYTIQLFKNGHAVEVTVDDLVPTYERQASLPCYAHSICNTTTTSASVETSGVNQPSSSVDVWASVVEKAYAKLHGGYDRLHTGSIGVALQDLTNCYFYKWTWDVNSVATIIRQNNKKKKETSSLSTPKKGEGEYVTSLEGGAAVPKEATQMGTQPVVNWIKQLLVSYDCVIAEARARGPLELAALAGVGLVPNAGYIIERVFEQVTDAHHTVLRIVSPDFKVQWQGRFKVGSAEWVAGSRQVFASMADPPSTQGLGGREGKDSASQGEDDRLYSVNEHWKEQRNQGTNVMTIEDFLAFFNSIVGIKFPCTSPALACAHTQGVKGYWLDQVASPSPSPSAGGGDALVATSPGTGGGLLDSPMWTDNPSFYLRAEHRYTRVLIELTQRDARLLQGGQNRRGRGGGGPTPNYSTIQLLAFVVEDDDESCYVPCAPGEGVPAAPPAVPNPAPAGGVNSGSQDSLSPFADTQPFSLSDNNAAGVVPPRLVPRRRRLLPLNTLVAAVTATSRTVTLSVNVHPSKPLYIVACNSASTTRTVPATEAQQPAASPAQAPQLAVLTDVPPTQGGGVEVISNDSGSTNLSSGGGAHHHVAAESVQPVRGGYRFKVRAISRDPISLEEVPAPSTTMMSPSNNNNNPSNAGMTFLLHTQQLVPPPVLRYQGLRAAVQSHWRGSTAAGRLGIDGVSDAGLPGNMKRNNNASSSGPSRSALEDRIDHMEDVQRRKMGTGNPQFAVTVKDPNQRLSIVLTQTPAQKTEQTSGDKNNNNKISSVGLHAVALHTVFCTTTTSGSAEGVGSATAHLLEEITKVDRCSRFERRKTVVLELDAWELWGSKTPIAPPAAPSSPAVKSPSDTSVDAAVATTSTIRSPTSATSPGVVQPPPPPPRSFVIVPTTWGPGEEAEFTLAIYSEKPVSLKRMLV